MAEITLSKLAEYAEGDLLGEPPAEKQDPTFTVVKNLARDNREVVPGSIFIAIAGNKVDGHKFVGDAIKRGAVGALVTNPEIALKMGAKPWQLVLVKNIETALSKISKKWLQFLREEGKKNHPGEVWPLVLGITGSVGKTTTKDITTRIFQRTGTVVSPIKSFNNEIGLPITVMEANTDTKTIVIEMGADRVGNIDYLCNIAPLDGAAVLAVRKAHLGCFGGIEQIAATKAEIISGINTEAKNAGRDFVVLNLDDPLVRNMSSRVEGEILGFRSEPEDLSERELRVWASNITVDGLDRPTFQLHWRPKSVSEALEYTSTVSLGISGKHNIYNALAAATLALGAGVDFQEVLAGIDLATANSEHRMSVSELGKHVLIDDSYNANPSSMRAGLESLRAIASPDISDIIDSGKLAKENRRALKSLAVLGQMLELGENSEKEHYEIGKFAAQIGIDEVFVLGEDAEFIARGFAGYKKAKQKISVFSSKSLLQEQLEEYLQSENQYVILFKGSNGSGIWKMVDNIQERFSAPEVKSVISSGSKEKGK